MVALAVTALFVLGTGGVVAATVTDTPIAPTVDAPSDTASPANYTVEVVDPDDELNEQDVEDAREIAWANETVRSYFSANESVHFKVWASRTDDGNVSVWLSTNESAPARVVADVGAGSVTDVDEPETLTADEFVKLDLDENSIEEGDDGVYRIEPSDDEAAGNATGDGNAVRLTANDSTVVHCGRNGSDDRAKASKAEE